MSIGRKVQIRIVLALLCAAVARAKPFVIKLEIPVPQDSAGGVITADVDDNASELHVYQNDKSNPRPNEKRLWADRNYRRLKQCYNYYSP